MGSPVQMDEQHHSRPSSASSTKATFSGMTALVGVIALIISIVSVAIPYWGSYGPAGAFYFQQGLPSQENTGTFGPFQSCKNLPFSYYCGHKTVHQASTWLVVAGICAIVTVICYGVFCLFAILHVAMQLQRKEILLNFQRAVFLKVISSAVAVVSCIAAVILGGLEFSLGSRTSALVYKMGICYYLQIVLIFVSALLVILSYTSYRKIRKHPLPIAPRNSSISYDGRHSSNGVSMTQSSGQPYLHGQPRIPNQKPGANTSLQLPYNAYLGPAANSPSSSPQPAMMPAMPPAQNGAYSLSGPPMGMANGFTTATLTVPMSQNAHHYPQQQQQQQQPLPVQSIRPVQPVQGVPQMPMMDPASMAPAIGSGQFNRGLPGVSFVPGGRGVPTYNKMSGPGGTGSMESLDSTQSLTLSTYSYGSSTSTGSGHGPLRSSLKKPKQRDITSVSSRSSSKQVRISLGAEQTTV